MKEFFTDYFTEYFKFDNRKIGRLEFLKYTLITFLIWFFLWGFISPFSTGAIYMLTHILLAWFCLSYFSKRLNDIHYDQSFLIIPGAFHACYIGLHFPLFRSCMNGALYLLLFLSTFSLFFFLSFKRGDSFVKA